MESSVDDFLNDQKILIELEQTEDFLQNQQLIQENDSKTLETMGLALNNLKFKSQKLGLYGRILITLVSSSFSNKVKDPQNPAIKDSSQTTQIKLPRNKFSCGDLVSIYENTAFFSLSKPIVSGLIYKTSELKLLISLEQTRDLEKFDLEDILSQKKLSLLLNSNEVTYKRHLLVLQRIKETIQTSTRPAHRLSNVLLFPEDKFSEHPKKNFKNLEFYDKSLNSEQQTAIEKALEAESLFLIHGPPGTGKTKTLCELIAQCVKRKMRVLACGPSNISVDNMAERLNSDIKACRIGNPVRLMPEIMKKSLDFLITKSEGYKIIKERKREVRMLLNKKGKKTENRRELNKMISSLRKEIKGLELMTISETLFDSQVILSTNTTADDKILRKLKTPLIFDVVIIDEAAQALEISCWIPLLLGKKLILAGDHKQLPPTIKSKVALEKGFGVTLFDRMIQKFPQLSQILKVQYRMNEKIMQWSSQFVYGGVLMAAENVKNHSVKDFGIGDYPILLFLDTYGSKMGEIVPLNTNQKKSIVTQMNSSKANKGEGDLVLILFKELLEQGVKACDIGIITPYNAQVDLIKKLFENSINENLQLIEISTVDGFQGREKEAIIISMVRSNPSKIVGFLKDFRRMNVAITRAKRFVALVGDSETIKEDEFLRNLLEYFEANGEHQMALQYKGVYDNIHFNEGWFENIKGVGEKPKDGKKSKKKVKKKEENKANEANEEEKGNNDKDNKEDDRDEIKQKFFKKIEEFINDTTKSTLEFESLNSFERMKIHEIAEEAGLTHKSTGEGNKRIIILQKNNIKENIGKFSVISEKKVEEESKLLETKEKKPLLIFEKLGEEEKNSIIEKKEKNFPDKKQNKTNKISNKQAKLNSKKKSEELDDDEFLDKMIELNKVCNFVSAGKVHCDKKVHLIKLCCQFCNKIFCLTHGNAETHGCGNLASYSAQIKFRDQCMNNINGNLGECKPEEKEYLKMKLQNKMSKSQHERKTRNKKEKK